MEQMTLTNGKKSCTISKKEADSILEALQAMMHQYNNAIALCSDAAIRDAVTAARHSAMRLHGKLCDVMDSDV